MKHSFRYYQVVLISVILVLGGFVFYGCDSDDPACPPAPTTGKIIIGCTPDDISIPWILAQPGGLTANGLSDSTLTDMPAGAYTLTWSMVDGWNVPSPNPATGSLEVGSAIAFSGIYTEAQPVTSNIVINPEPNDINASWQLSGPEGYITVGTGDYTLSDLLVGNYSLEWGEVTEWDRPNPRIFSQYLDVGEMLVFDGQYSYMALPDGFVLIPPASVSMPAAFTMGSAVGSDEAAHQVTLTRRFSMASTEVTNAQYVEALQWAYDQGYVTATTASVRDNLDGSSRELLDLDSAYCEIDFSGGAFNTSNHGRPVVQVSWYGSVAYCDWLSLQNGLSWVYDHSTWSCNNGNPYNALGYRLPTEAEWEFACRAGTTTYFNTGDCLDAGTEANYLGRYPYTDCPLGPDLYHSMDVGSYPTNQWG